MRRRESYKAGSRRNRKLRRGAVRRPCLPATGEGVNDKFTTGVNRRSGVMRNPGGVRPNNWSSEFDA